MRTGCHAWDVRPFTDARPPTDDEAVEKPRRRKPPMTTLPPQPTDEWEFLSTDDAPAGEVDLDTDLPRAAEVAAMHIEATEALRPYNERTTAGDERGDGPPVAYFDDEEPEEPRRVARRDDDGPVPDLEDILESQHYAFSPENEDVP
jgi:hypothetical protein